MSPTPTPLNPSQAVERIREIIVGRHLERLEARVASLETGAPGSSGPPSHFDDRLCQNEARLEALQDSLRRLSEVQHEHTRHHAHRQEEVQRLAGQIQRLAALRTEENHKAAVDSLERKIGVWLGNWQKALQKHLEERDERLAEKLRGEVAQLWESTEEQITRLEGGRIDQEQIERRFRKIAEAARALAESAAPDALEPEPAPAR